MSDPSPTRPADPTTGDEADDAPVTVSPVDTPEPATPEPRVLVPSPVEFVDLAGRRWSVVLDAEAVANVRSCLGIDFAALAHEPDGGGYRFAITLALTPARLRDVLWTLAGDDAHARGVGIREFFDGFGWSAGRVDAGQAEAVLDKAAVALIGGIAARWPDSPFAADSRG